MANDHDFSAFTRECESVLKNLDHILRVLQAVERLKYEDQFQQEMQEMESATPSYGPVKMELPKKKK
jgi:hypothetical protein